MPEPRLTALSPPTPVLPEARRIAPPAPSAAAAPSPRPIALPAEPPPVSGDEPVWPDETVESAFIAEARDRGEVLATPPARADNESEEAVDGGALPALDELVQRIPPEVRETLDDLFRVRFVRVQRVPKNALKR